MQNSTLVIVIVAALAVLGGGWYYLSSQAEPAPASVGETNSEDSSTSTAPDEAGGVEVDVGAGVSAGGSEESLAPMTATVTYSASGFAPSAVTVKVGGTVIWQDQGTGNMWVAAAQHPTHTSYSGTTLHEHCGGSAPESFDQCAKGASYSFTFTKAGTWRYHNHSQASHFGTVIVEE